MDTNFKSIISSAMPFIGSLIGGPVGEKAGTLLSKIITGKDNATEEEIRKSILNASPEKLIELQKIDNEYRAKLIDADIEDSKSARETYVKINDKITKDTGIVELFLSKMPAVLSILLTSGFFAILLIFMLYPVQHASREVMEVMIGSLGTAWIQSINFYFGTTHGSQQKTRFIAEKIDNKSNDVPYRTLNEN